MALSEVSGDMVDWLHRQSTGYLLYGAMQETLRDGQVNSLLKPGDDRTSLWQLTLNGQRLNSIGEINDEDWLMRADTQQRGTNHGKQTNTIDYVRLRC